MPALLRPALPPYLMISEEHRFLFCGIPKVGLTEWLHLFLRVTGDSAWNTTRPWDYVHYTAKRQAFSMKKLQISAQRWDEIMRDPGFVKAVFLRDPAERILSAFMDKFVWETPPLGALVLVQAQPPGPHRRSLHGRPDTPRLSWT